MEKSQISNFWVLYPTACDAVSGLMAGLVAGVAISPFEYTKMLLQIEPLSRPRRKFWRRYFSKKTLIGILRATTPVSIGTALVCTLEFSVNERVKRQYGTFLGLLASSLTGSLFLSASEHLVYRREKAQETVNEALKALWKIRANALWAGFIPIAIREASFILTILYTGPYLGHRLEAQFGHSDSSRAMGRLISAFFLSAISQPFDVLGRYSQISLYEQPSIRFSLMDAAKKRINTYKLQTNNKHIHPLFVGLMPRTGVCAVGAPIIGYIYDKFKDYLVYKHII